MGIQVIKREETKVVGISWNGTYSEMSTIPELFTKMRERLNEVSHQTREPFLIAPFHSRETEFTYYVTKPVEKLDEIPEGMIGFTIPGKNYVNTVHKGSLENVLETYNRLFAWMEEYGYERDHYALCLEIFKEEHKLQNGLDDLHFEIYVPVKTYK
ncbi:MULTISPECIES: GyrI-like domain-containing protein [Bacillaceae]|uniref:GyrI-like domain-containing protein n=1 Tax=Bacillaceae TaxID=186817 RepID=UPI0016807902|nr:GyrI-like domain-containing protein [Bacillus sp. S3]